MKDGAQMNKESLGKRYKRGNDVYECIAYTDNPTVTMENIETGERIGVVIDSMVADEFEPIIERYNKIEQIDTWSNDIEENQFILKAKIDEIIKYVNNMENSQ